MVTDHRAVIPLTTWFHKSPFGTIAVQIKLIFPPITYSPFFSSLNKAHDGLSLAAGSQESDLFPPLFNIKRKCNNYSVSPTIELNSRDALS